MSDSQPGSALATRFAKVRAQSTLLTGAILAAHGAAERGEGFRPMDVRFFFLLFANWVERDLETPGHDLDLTQVRRALDQLVAAGAAAHLGARGRHDRARRYVLDASGVLALATELFAPRTAPPLAEALFVVSFAACYGPTLAGPATGLPAAARKRLAQLCDLPRIVREAMQRVKDRIADLDERVRSSLALSEQAARLRARGEGEDEIARRLEAERAYQLHHVRPFSAVIGSLPEAQRAFELGPAMDLRARLLFEPLAEAARAELAVWARVLEGIAALPKRS
jgi:hypothetical protein